MMISQAGINMIENLEGFREKAYKCVAGVNTIGFGTTIYHTGEKVKAGDTITRKKAEKEITYYIKKNIEPKLDSYTWLTQAQYDSLCSLLYNIGSMGKTLKSAMLTKNITKVKNAVLQYNKAGGKVVQGLVDRRNIEAKSFDTKIRVRVFQSLTKGLKVDGICGKKTTASIPLLKRGSKGNYVKMIQHWLGCKADGIFGKDTERFVIDFQQRNGLKADGIIGEKTMLSLFGL